MRAISGEQIAEAIKLGGYKQGFRHFFQSATEQNSTFLSLESQRDAGASELLDACATGIAALNLGVDVYSLENVIRYYYTPWVDNDSGKNLDQIARATKKKLKGLNFEVQEFDYSTLFSNYQGKKV